MDSARVENSPGRRVEPLPRDAYGAAKRAVDVAFAAALLVVLAPLLAAIAIAVRLDSRGPALLRQRRPGRRASEFINLKFRTTRVGTPDLASHPAGPAGPQVTRVGGLLRRTSLDELPQLFNVLAGDMTLVGPPPALHDQDDLIALRIARSLNNVARIVKHELLTSQPLAVEIETTTVCNRKCVYCPNSTIGRPNARMDAASFYRIIDSLNSIRYKGRISPHFYGEPLMDDRIVDFMAYTRRQLPGATIVFFTNGERLTVEMYLGLKRAGVDVIRISQHTERPSKTTSDTLDYIRSHHPELYTVETVNYYQEYHDHNPHNLLNNRGGTVEVTFAAPLVCEAVNWMTFDYRGDAVLCYNDYNSSITFGNIRNRQLIDIWKSKEYVAARRALLRGYGVADICKRCLSGGAPGQAAARSTAGAA